MTKEKVQPRRRRRKPTPFTLPIPGFGVRPLTTEDFERACAREGVTVLRRALPKGINGLYTMATERPCIFIDSRLRGARKVTAEFHELAHHFLHNGRKEIAHYSIDADEHAYTPEQRWAEVEADTAALIAITPDYLISYMLRLAAEDQWRRRPQVGRKGGRE